MTVRTIFVRLLNEGVDVWRPVVANHVGGSVHKIAAQPYDRTAETCEFDPGADVVCQEVNLDGGVVLGAMRLAALGE